MRSTGPRSAKSASRFSGSAAGPTVAESRVGRRNRSYGFYDDGLIDDARAVLGTVEFTEEGVIEAEKMLRKHFQNPTDAGTKKAIDGGR